MAVDLQTRPVHAACFPSRSGCVGKIANDPVNCPSNSSSFGRPACAVRVLEDDTEAANCPCFPARAPSQNGSNWNHQPRSPWAWAATRQVLDPRNNSLYRQHVVIRPGGCRARTAARSCRPSPMHARFGAFLVVGRGKRSWVHVRLGVGGLRAGVMIRLPQGQVLELKTAEGGVGWTYAAHGGKGVFASHSEPKRAARHQ